MPEEPATSHEIPQEFEGFNQAQKEALAFYCVEGKTVSNWGGSAQVLRELTDSYGQLYQGVTAHMIRSWLRWKSIFWKAAKR